MRRILFVDDEVGVLEALRDALAGRGDEWDMRLARDAPAAVQALGSETFDVVASDLRLPGVTGAELLARVQASCPEAVRVILCDEHDMRGALREAPAAHAFVTKPCDPGALAAVVERACLLREMLGDEALRHAVNRAGALPSVPRLYTRLLALGDDPDATSADVAEVVEQDVAMSAKVLGMVNSAYFSLRREIGTVREAVHLLGLETIKALALSVEAFRCFEGRDGADFSIEALHEHSVRVAALARDIAPSALRDTAFVAGLLHDVGKLVLATSAEPAYWRELVAEAVASFRPLHEIERERRGVTHAEVGAYLLSLWSLPHPVVEAVAFHHQPERTPLRTFDAVAAVHAADALVHERSPLGEPAGPELDRGLLDDWGVADRLADWRRRAAA